MSADTLGGYAYELAGLVFYVFFLSMVRKRSSARYTQRSRVLTVVAAIGLVAVVPLHLAGNAAAIGAIVLLAAAALGSATIDARTKR